MRPLKIFAVLIILNICAWIIPQETFAQNVTASYQSFLNDPDSYDTWGYSPDYSIVSGGSNENYFLTPGNTIINISNSDAGIKGINTADNPGNYNIRKLIADLKKEKFEKAANSKLKFVSLNGNTEVIKTSLNENEVNVYQPVINDLDKNPTKVILLPIKDKVINYNSEYVYNITPAVDIPIVTVGSIWSVFALSKIYTKTSPTAAEIQGLNKDNIPAFDRWSIYPYNDKLEKLSYYPFYASIPLPFIFFLSNEKTSHDFFRLSFLYWETLSIMGVIGTSSTYYVDRYRPYCYTDETPMDRRTSKVARNSFFSGHVEMVAAPTFLIAKVYSDYYPESKIKWVFYGFASTITATTAYLRLRGGDHFPSDIILGALVGALSGILVPEFHKNNNSDLSVLPYSNEMAKGIAFNYQF